MRPYKRVFEGLRFGLLLQLAVGPVCLLVFQTSVALGTGAALRVVAAVTLTDAFYIALSAMGAAVLFSSPGAKRWARLAGGLVLCLFGGDMLLGVWGATLLPGIRLISVSSVDGLFWRGLALTLANPLTILFWGGALAAKVSDESFDHGELLSFAVGCVLATVLFLTGVACIGHWIGQFLPDRVIDGMNLLVGLALMAFGVRLMIRK